MGKTIKISPIEKSYSPSFRTMESSLGAKGMTTSPGTYKKFSPQREADGRYRTGIDKTATWIKALEPEEQEAEFQFIDRLVAKLKDYYGDKVDFGPRSKVWQPFSGEEVTVSLIPLGNEPVLLNPDINAQDLLNYCWIRVDKRIARSSESYMRGECPNCQFYVENEEIEARTQFAKNKLESKALVDFEKLTPTKQKQMARLVGLPISDNSTEESTYNMMYAFLKQKEVGIGNNKGKSPIIMFNELIRLSDDRLYAKDLVEQAIRHNIYREGQGDKIVEGNETIAGSKDDLVNQLLDENNQRQLLALEARVKNKKMINV